MKEFFFHMFKKFYGEYYSYIQNFAHIFHIVLYIIFKQLSYE